MKRAIGSSIGSTIGPAFITALAGLLLAGLINLVASNARPVAVVVAAMQGATIESRTPYELAPWWLRTRAQADCQSVQRVFQTSRPQLDNALSPVVFGDRQGNARPCEILAGYLFQPDQERISKQSLHAGPTAAGSTALLLATATGWRGVGYAELALLFAIIAYCGIRIWRGELDAARRLLLPAAVATGCIVLAMPGSITLFPIVLVLLVLASSAEVSARVKHAWVSAVWLPAACGALLFVLDPQAGSVAAGLSVLLSVVVLHHRHEWRDAGARMVSAFILSASISAILYIPAVLLFSKVGTTTLSSVLLDLLADRPVSGWLFDLPASLVEAYEWLGSGPLYFQSIAFLMLWTLPFVLISTKWTNAEGTVPTRLQRTVYGLLPFAPVLAWIVSHPGFLRRNPDAYAALIAVVLAFVLAVAAEKLLSKRRARIAEPAHPTEAIAAETIPGITLVAGTMA